MMKKNKGQIFVFIRYYIEELYIRLGGIVNDKNEFRNERIEIVNRTANVSFFTK